MRHLIIPSITTAIFATISCGSKNENCSADFIEKTSIQVRVYADFGVRLPSGETGNAIQFYGMEVQEDGSETMKWKVYIAENNYTKFSKDYAEFNADDNTTYLYVPTFGRRLEGDKHIYYQIDRATGKILRKGLENDEYFENVFNNNASMKRVIIERPATTGDWSQKTDEKIDEKLEEEILDENGKVR